MENWRKKNKSGRDKLTNGEKNMAAKDWYKSKTFWVNTLALAALVVQAQVGFVVSPEEQMSIVIVINLGLKAFTGEGLVVGGVNLKTVIRR